MELVIIILLVVSIAVDVYTIKQVKEQEKEVEQLKLDLFETKTKLEGFMRLKFPAGKPSTTKLSQDRDFNY